MSTILLTGKNGQLGFELQRALACLGTVHAVGSADCNLADEAALRALVQEVKPDFIVNPAAYTAVDKAETESALAYAVNADAPRILGEEAAKLGASVIHFSTDYVFDGTLDIPYNEQVETNPQSVYGATKRAGELGLMAATAKHLIFRTSWVVGAHGGNFAKTMLRLAADRDELKVVADQMGAPTSAALLADVTAHVLRQLQTSGEPEFPFGLYHLCASGATNWHAYAGHVIDQAQALGHPLRITSKNVLPIRTEDYPTPAKRPKNSRMDTRSFQRAFGLELPDWRQGVDHILKQIL